MIKKKRIIAFFAAVLTVFSLCFDSFAFIDDVDDVPLKDITAQDSTAGQFSEESVLNAYKLLKYIGCVLEEKESFEENDAVTKGYAAQGLAVAAAGRTSETFHGSFSDVPDAHEYAGGISQALEKGIIDEGDRFYPNKNVSMGEIADMALRALKYNYIYFAGTPLEQATELGLFKNVDCSENLITKGQFMIFLKNVLDTDYIKVSDLDKDGNAKVEIVDGVSHLEKYFGIYKQDGVVSGYKYSSINGDADLPEDKIQINRGIFEIDGESYLDYVGQYVDAYVDADQDNRVIMLYPNNKKTAVYSLHKGDFSDASTGYINYYQDNRSKRAKISDTSVVMYNNVYHGLYSRLSDYTIFEEADKIVLADNDGDNNIDIIKIEKYTYYLVKTVSKEKETINFDKNGGVLEIDDKSWVEFILNGSSAGLEDLKKSDVLTVLESVRKDGSKVFSGVVTRKIEEGKISQIGKDELGEYYELEKSKFYLSDEYINYISVTASEKKPVAGDFVRLYISADGKVVASAAEEDFSYGYIMSGIYDETEEVVRFKIYNLSGEANSYYFADRVKVYTEKYPNGIKRDKTEAIKIYLDGDMTVKNDCVAYSLNSNGEIASVVKPINRTAYKHGSMYYPLTYDFNGESLISQNASSRLYRGVFAMKYKMDSSVQFMVIPQDKSMITNEKAYAVQNGGYWGISHYFVNENIKMYNCDKFYIPQFCTMESVVSGSIGQGDGDVHMYCIEKVEKTIDEDDMPVVKISYFENGRLTESVISADVEFETPGLYCSTDEVSKLQKGDIIQISKDALGEINIINVFFSIKNRPGEFGAYFSDITKTDASGKTHIEPVPEAVRTMTSLSVLYARVEDIRDNVVLINTSKTGHDEQYTYPMVVGNSVYGAVYYNIYNTKTNKVTAATLDEIQPNDVVVMRRYYNHVQDVVIIR